MTNIGLRYHKAADTARYAARPTIASGNDGIHPSLHMGHQISEGTPND